MFHKTFDMENKKNYELDFCDALEIILDGGAVKGDWDNLFSYHFCISNYVHCYC